MAIFKRKKKRKKGGTKVGNLFRKIAGRTILGKTVNTARNISKSIKPKAVSSKPAQPAGLNYTPAYQTIKPTYQNSYAGGLQTLAPKNAINFDNYGSGMTLAPKSKSQRTSQSTVLPSASRSSGSSRSSSSGGSSMPTSVSRGGGGSMPASSARTAPTGSVYRGGIATSPTAPKATGSLNAPLGAAVIGTNDFDYNLTPQQVAEKEARERLTQYQDREADQDVNEKSIYRDTLRKFQGEIDATNEIMAEKLRQARMFGQSRLGSTRAENFNAGAVDSSFGNAAMQRTTMDNMSMENAILAEKVQAIAQIENQARELGNAYFQQRKEAKESGLTGYLDAIKNAGTAKEAIAFDIAESIFNNGVTVDEIKPATLSKIAKDAGITVQQIKNSYASVLTAMEEEAQDTGFTLGKDQVRYDQFGNVIAGGATAGGEMGVSSDAMAWAEAIKNGQATIANAPEELRGEILQAMQTAGEGVTNPIQQRALDQANVARGALQDIFSNPAIDRGALNRGIGRIIPGSNTKDLRESVKTIQALVGFNELQKMRDASPTGGALGQVSEREIDFLQALGGSINLSQSDEQLVNNLSRIQEAFDKLFLVNAPEGTTDFISGVQFTKQGDNLITEAPDGRLYKLRPDGQLDEVDPQSFNQASSIGSVDEALEKIGAVESGGNYQALGPVLNSGQYKGQRAIGKYQVMEGNIPSWSKMALGYSVTPEEFYNNPQIQDAIAQDQFNRNFEKYGNWDDAASVWFTGRPLAKAGNAKDQLGTSVQEYVKRFNMA